MWLRWWRRWRREERWVSWERSSFEGRRGVDEGFDIVGGVSSSFAAVAGLWSLSVVIPFEMLALSLFLLGK